MDRDAERVETGSAKRQKKSNEHTQSSSSPGQPAHLLHVVQALEYELRHAQPDLLLRMREVSCVSLACGERPQLRVCRRGGVGCKQAGGGRRVARSYCCSPHSLDCCRQGRHTKEFNNIVNCRAHAKTASAIAHDERLENVKISAQAKGMVL